MRKMMSLLVAVAVLIAGLSAVLYSLTEGGKLLILLAGITALVVAFFWIKEDFARSQADS